MVLKKNIPLMVKNLKQNMRLCASQVEQELQE